MTDYHCYPIWHDGDDVFGDINPEDFPISLELKNDLMEWSNWYDRGIDLEDFRNSITMTESELLDFHKKGRELNKRLQIELGTTYEVRYWMDEEP